MLRVNKGMRVAYLALIELDVPNACLIHSREIAEQMVELGHEVEMFLPLPLKQQKWQGIRHHWIRFWGFDAMRRSCFMIEASIRLWCEHKRRPFDCLYLRELEGSEVLVRVCRWLSLPLFVEVNGWLLDDLNLTHADSSYLQAAQRSQGQLMRASIGVIASTVGNTRNVKNHYGVQRVLTQELGVNAELFTGVSKHHARQRLLITGDMKIILFAGSFHPHHDLKTLIQAFGYVSKQLSNVRLLLVGDGAQFQQAQSWVSEAGVESAVEFVGSQPYEEMPYWFAAADLLVSPLIEQKIKQQNGALATKVWEAMAAGTRVLVTDIQGSESYDLLSELAWVTSPEDVEGMTSAILDALEADEGRVLRAQSYVLQERSWRKAAADSIAFMQQCLRGV